MILRNDIVMQPRFNLLRFGTQTSVTSPSPYLVHYALNTYPYLNPYCQWQDDLFLLSFLLLCV